MVDVKGPEGRCHTKGTQGIRGDLRATDRRRMSCLAANGALGEPSLPRRQEHCTQHQGRTAYGSDHSKAVRHKLRFKRKENTGHVISAVTAARVLAPGRGAQGGDT